MAGYPQHMMPHFQQRAPPSRPPQQDIDFNTFDNETIKQHLISRSLSTVGERPVLVQRLKDEVNKAWSQYYARSTGPSQQPPNQFGMNQMQPNYNRFNQNQTGGGFGGGNNTNNFQDRPKKKKRRKRKRSTLTEEERAKLEEERRTAREAKEARKAENKKKELEAREKKRLKREAAASRQAEMEKKQKLQKENRQRSEVFVYFDMKAFSDQLMSALDPDGSRVNACNYDFSHKGFRVRFTDPTHAIGCAKGATMSKPRTISVPTKLSVLPAPIESHCVFFLDPCHAGHPEKEQSFEWVSEQGVKAKTSDINVLNLWKKSAVEAFCRFGTIVNIYRERGFIVVQYQTEDAAESMFEALKENETLNAISLLFMKHGTPKKRDRLECDKKYPKLPKIKAPKPEAEETKDGETVKAEEGKETVKAEETTETGETKKAPEAAKVN